MKKKNVVIAVSGLVLMLAVAVLAILQLRERAVSVPEKKQNTQEERHASKGKHGGKARRRRNTGGSVFPKPQTGGRKTSGLHKQTPEEAVEFARRGLESYRNQSPEVQARIRDGISRFNGMIGVIRFQATQFAGRMNEQQRQEAREYTSIALENLNAIEWEVLPEMTEEEAQVFGEAIRNAQDLSVTFLDALQ